MAQVLFDRLKSNLAQCINDGTIYFVKDSNGNFTQIALGDGSKSHVVGIGPKMDDATKQELMSKLGLTISSDMGTIQLGKLSNFNGVSSQKVITYERTGLGTDTHEISTVGYVQQYMKTAKAMVYAGIFNAQTKEITDYNNAIISPSEEGNVTFNYLLNGNEGETLLTSGMSFIVGTAGDLEGYTGISVYGGQTKVEVGDMIIIINVQPKEGNEGGSTYNEASILIIQNTNLDITEFKSGIIYDVSAHNDGAVFESLSALLSASNLSTLIPTSVRHGGMSIRFIQGSEQSSDNKYVQYRLTNQSWSINTDDWQEIGSADFSTGEKVSEVGIDVQPTYGSENLVKSGGVYPLSVMLRGGMDYSIEKSYTSANGTSISAADGVVGTIKAGTVTRWYIEAVNTIPSLTSAYFSVSGEKSQEMLIVGDKTSYFDYIVPNDTTSITMIRIMNSSNNTVAGKFRVEFFKEKTVTYQEDFLSNNSIKAKNIALDESSSALGDGSSKILSISLKPFDTSEMLSYNDIFVCFRVKSNKPCTLYSFLGSSIATYYDWRNSKGNPDIQQGIAHEIIRPTELNADTYTTIYGVKRDYPSSTSGAARVVSILADYTDTSTQNGATLDIDRIVIINVSKTFGSDSKVDKNTIYNYISAFKDNYFSGEVEFVHDKLYKLNNSLLTLNDESTKGYIELTKDCNIEMGGEINPNWDGWSKAYWSYGQSPLCDPVPSMLHGKLHTDSLFSVCPTYGNWGPKAVTTNGDNWGGHVFHGWNSRMTYRLTMMASGGMTKTDGGQREDEFCIHSFSPANSVPSYPITENTPLVEKDEEDRFGNDAWYGRVRIGADTGTEGFVFRAKSLTCYGRIDMNGKPFILGEQTNIPATSNSEGKKGTITFDINYLYICVADNTWKRIHLETW